MPLVFTTGDVLILMRIMVSVGMMVTVMERKMEITNDDLITAKPISLGNIMPIILF